MSDQVSLGEVCDFIRGVTFDKAAVRSRPAKGFIPILRAGNIQESLRTDADLIWVPRELVDDQQLLKRDDIAICMSSGSSDVVGKTACATSDMDISVGSFCGIIRPKKSSRSAILPFFFQSDSFKRYRDRIARGANIQNLRFSRLEEIPINFPQEVEERTAELIAADKLRRTHRFALQLCDEFLPASFLEMFGDPKENPKCYPLVAAGELFDPARGVKCGPFGSALKKHEYVASGVPVWTMENVQANNFVENGCAFITPEKYRQLAAYDARNGDILISRAGTVGRMAVVRTKAPKSIIHSNLIRLSLNGERLAPEYFVILMTYFARRVARLKTGQEEAYTFMNTGTLEELPIPLPPVSEQKKFLELLRQHEAFRATQVEALRQADHLFQSLLRRAFNGNH